MTGPGLTEYLLIGALLFVCGVICMATKRNAIGVLMGVELVLNGANVNLVAFSNFNSAFEVEGMTFALFVIVLAAGEAAVALAIVLNFYNNHTTVDVDTAEELKGYSMPVDFGAHPGLWFVVATLLPLASFVLILLWRGLRLVVKPYRDAGFESLYQVLGGDRENRGAAYIATGAIGLAFVCSLVGFVLFLGEQTGGHG